MIKTDITKYTSTTLKDELTKSEIQSVYNAIMNIAYELENKNADKQCINRYFNTLHNLMTK